MSFNFDYDIELVDEDTEQSTNNNNQTGSTIFTQTVIAHINKFITEEVYLETIRSFKIEESTEFKKVIQDAENGQTEFEIEIDLDEIDDPDVFDYVMQTFFDEHIFDEEYRYMTRVSLKIDQDAKTLEVSACMLLGRYGGYVEGMDSFIVDGEVSNLSEYIDMMMENRDEDARFASDEDEWDWRDAAEENIRSKFANAKDYDPSRTYKSAVIALGA